MNYELAKKLKDAGFPQKGTGTIAFDGNDKLGEEYGTSSVYLPTLSELIAACGIDFVLLLQTGHSGSEWRADSTELEMFGSTPEEAVANLYLALHTKS